MSASRLRGRARGASLVEYIVIVATIATAVIGGVKVFGKEVKSAAECQGEAITGAAAGGGAPCGGNISAKPGSGVGSVASLPQGPGALACDAMGCSGTGTTRAAKLDDTTEVAADPSAIMSGPPEQFQRKKEPDTNYNVNRLGVIEGVPFVKGEGQSTAISPQDVSQGMLGDCWFVSPLATMANLKPGMLEEHLRVLGPGQYSVKLFLNGNWKWVNVDNKFPVAFRDRDHKHKKWVWQTADGGPVFIHPGQSSKDGPELWPMLFESAMAKARGGFNAIDGGWGGDAMEALTGQRSVDYDPSKMQFKQFSEFVGAKYGVIVGTNADPKPGQKPAPLFRDDTLVTGHAYWVESVDDAKKTVTVRNPWGWDQKPVTLTWKQFQEHFSDVAVNPITDRHQK